MAGYACTGCDGDEPAVILITPLNGAETMPIGQNCMPVTLCGMLAATIGADPEALWTLAEAAAHGTQAQAAAEAGGGQAGTPAEGGQAASGPPGAAQAASGAQDEQAPKVPAARPAARRGGRPRRGGETVRGLAPLSPELRGQAGGEAS